MPPIFTCSKVIACDGLDAISLAACFFFIIETTPKIITGSINQDDGVTFMIGVVTGITGRAAGVEWAGKNDLTGFSSRSIICSFLLPLFPVIINERIFAMKKPANDIFTSTEVGTIIKGLKDDFKGLKDDFRTVGARLDVLTGEVHQLKTGFKIFGEDLTAVKSKVDMVYNEMGRQREDLWSRDKRLSKVEAIVLR